MFVVLTLLMPTDDFFMQMNTGPTVNVPNLTIPIRKRKSPVRRCLKYVDHLTETVDAEEVVETRRITSLRIHVERVMEN